MLCVSEYMSAGNLETAIRKDRERGDGRRVLGWHCKGRSVALDVARGLAFLHSNQASTLPTLPYPNGALQGSAGLALQGALRRAGHRARPRLPAQQPG